MHPQAIYQRSRKNRFDPDFKIEETPSWKIFHLNFKVRVPYGMTLNKEQIKRFGHWTTTDPEYDNILMNELITVYWTIDKMYEKFKEGVTVHITSLEDTRKIYEIIVGHLEVWKRFSGKSLNLRNIPYDDLEGLAEFADKVFQHAVWTYDTELPESELIRTMREGRRNNKRLFKDEYEYIPETGAVNALRKKENEIQVDVSKLAEGFKPSDEEDKVELPFEGLHHGIMSQIKRPRRFGGK